MHMATSFYFFLFKKKKCFIDLFVDLLIYYILFIYNLFIIDLFILSSSSSSTGRKE